MTTADLAVVGAGLGGLAAAHFARRRGMAVRVFDAAPRAGGKVQTARVDGFTVEGGPLGWLYREPAVMRLARDLRLEPIVARQAAGRRWLLHGGRLVALPAGPWTFAAFPLLSWRGKARLLAEPFVRRRPPGGDESVRDFAARRLGPEAADVLFEAIVRGIFAGNGRELSLPACFPLLQRCEAEHGSVVRGFLALVRQKRRLRRAGQPVGDSRLYTLPEGVEQLARAAAAELGGALALETAVDSLRRDSGAWVTLCGGRELCRARQVVLSVPAAAAAALLREEAPELAAAAAGIRGDPLVVVTGAWPRERVRHPCDGFGFIAMRDEPVRLLGVQFAHAIFPGQTPPGWIQLRVLLGGASDPGVASLSDRDLVAAALHPLEPVLGLRGEAERLWIRRVPGGVPQYALGHLARVAAFTTAQQRLGGVFFGGDSFHGVGVNAVVARGFEIAERAAAGARG